MEKRSEWRRAWLLAALGSQAITALCAILPFRSVSLVLGAPFYFIAPLAYAAFWVLKLNYRERQSDDILLLFLPVYFYTAFLVLVVGGDLPYIIIYIIASLAAAVLSLISLSGRTKAEETSGMEKKRIIIMGFLSIMFMILAKVSSSELIGGGLLGILLTAFGILLLWNRKPSEEQTFLSEGEADEE